MDDAVIWAVIRRWESDSLIPDPHVVDDSEEGVRNELVQATRRHVKSDCAKTLRTLLVELGDQK